MADDEHLSVLKQSVTAWNKWRVSDPKFRPNLRYAKLERADLAGANLRGADLTDADLRISNLTDAGLEEADLADAYLSDARLTRANLTRANLTGADLTAAHLSDANLSGANLAGANLKRADLSGARLMGTDLTRASLGDTIFTSARVDSRTQGLEELTAVQRDGLVDVDRDPDVQSRAVQITVGTAQHIIGPAHEVLIGLSIPNGLSEAHRELFLELCRTVKDLQQSLADFKDENRRLSDNPEEFREKLDAALPLWKRAWETFVLKGAEVAGGGAVFTAGFIAGATYSAFTAEAPGISI